MIHLPINIIIVAESQFNKSQQMNWNHNDAVCESGSCVSFLQYRPMDIVIDADNTLSELMSVDIVLFNVPFFLSYRHYVWYIKGKGTASIKNKVESVGAIPCKLCSFKFMTT